MLTAKKIVCPECRSKIIIDREAVEVAKKKARFSGIYSLAFHHEDHVLLVYIDESGDIRGIETTPLFKSDKPLFLKFDIVPVPNSRDKMPSLNKLSNEELAVLSRCDGETSAREIAEALGVSYGQVKAILEKLFSEKYLKELKEVVI
ncbi:MAG: hypothetical protein DRN04_07520 [Thermoprotei archaeon]|nr:MAG: hypothetical protein DRN04_07520 [Thermoprotei archaeon]